MSRLRAAVSSALLVVALLAGVLAVPSRAAGRVPVLSFAGSELVLARALSFGSEIAVPIHDPGLTKFLSTVGAQVAYQPQERYVVFTAANRRTISFTLGSPQVSAGGIVSRLDFAPFVQNGEPFIPFYALARSLFVEPIVDGESVVLQPEIGALDLRSTGTRTTIGLHSALPVSYTQRNVSPNHLELIVAGVGAQFDGTRQIGNGTVTLATSGTVRAPNTIITVDFPRGTTHGEPTLSSPFDLSLDFQVLAKSDVTVASVQPVAPTVAPIVKAPTFAASTAPLARAAGAIVNRVQLLPLGDGSQVRIATLGSPTFEWHHLGDQRWYVDIKGATLNDIDRNDRRTAGPVESLRVRQVAGSDGVSFVRVAITLREDHRIDVTPGPDGLTVDIPNLPPIAGARIGYGAIGESAMVAALPTASPAPVSSATAASTVASASATGSEADPFAVFPGAYSSSKTIVIDPGHGGGDMGTAHNGLVEKIITLDVARRLRAVLVAQGWTVRMTRDADIDPVSAENLAAMHADGKPDPDDRAYLQTRCDVANAINARLFVSIHVNYSTSPAINGTTFYWYKPEDQALAKALERAVIPATGTNDIGPRRENFYVIHHTNMPAVLIETAFISNPGDAKLLASPTFLQSMATGIASGIKTYASATGVLPSAAPGVDTQTPSPAPSAAGDQ